MLIEMEHKALFVGDEPLLRDICEPLTEKLQGRYRIYKASTSEHAIAFVRQQRFDVVVTDLTAPEADGLQFLSQVVFHQPDCPRIMIASEADRVKIACLLVGHRYFSKPCDVDALRDLLLRLASFRDVVCNDKIRRLIGGLGSLPGPPETFLKLEKLLESRAAPLQEVAELVEQDPVLTAKLLQIVNSAHIGSSTRVFSVITAVQMLGLGMVRVLALGLHTFTAYNRRAGKNPPPSDLWDHSLRVATNARRIARANRFAHAVCERAFLAGLLHDVGRIVVHASAPQECAEIQELVRRCEIPSVIAEAQRFAATYADIGAYLLALWGIDDETTAIVQYLDRLNEFSGHDANALAAVHVAHALDAGNPISYPLQLEQLAALGFSAAAQWRASQDLAVLT
jgi:HD-like signal output (HDOD) protein/ActR/RegA family two-component response regulator